MATPTVLTAVVPADFWVQVEPNHSGGGAPHSCYSERLKADLVPGTFVSIVALNVDSPDVVARIVKAVGEITPPFLMEVNIFKSRAEIAVGEQQEIIVESHLRHLREIHMLIRDLVQTISIVTSSLCGNRLMAATHCIVFPTPISSASNSRLSCKSLFTPCCWNGRRLRAGRARLKEALTRERTPNEVR
jgi:hypothetical protein